jgi:ATP-dependent helicase HrpA
MARGTRRLLLLVLPSPVRQVRRSLRTADALALRRAPHGSVEALLADCADAAADALLARAGGPVWTRQAFATLAETVRTGLCTALADIVDAVVGVLAAAAEVCARLTEVRAPGVESSLADVRAQLDALVYPGFVAEAGAARLHDLTRYLRAAARRLETLPRQPERDREWMARVHEVQAAYAELSHPAPEIRWMIEELRVSFYAQNLGTRYPVSEKRIYRAIDDALS